MTSQIVFLGRARERLLAHSVGLANIDRNFPVKRFRLPTPTPSIEHGPAFAILSLLWIYLRMTCRLTVSDQVD